MRLAPTALLAGRALLLAVPLLLLARTASAYCFTTTVNPRDGGYEPTVEGCWKQGVTLHWPAAPIPIHLEEHGSRKVPMDMFQRVVDASFAKWGNVDCHAQGALSTAPARPRFQVENRGLTTVDVSDCKDSDCVDQRLGEAGLLLFHDDRWPYDGGAETYALTTLTYGTATGKVFGAYMEINTADHQYVEHSPAKPGFAGLDYVVTHEAGHFLGLAHSDDADALMYAHYKNEEATLHADDIAAICALEPATEPETKGCACSVRTSKSNAALVLVALGLVIVRLRPRTPRR